MREDTSSKFTQVYSFTSKFGMVNVLVGNKNKQDVMDGIHRAVAQSMINTGANKVYNHSIVHHK